MIRMTALLMVIACLFPILVIAVMILMMRKDDNAEKYKEEGIKND
jgi:hypothetical protein